MEHKTVAELFAKREAERSAKLDRARDHCRIVNPSLLPEEGFTQTTELPVPHSSTVTRFSSRLASKAAGAIVPINGSSFFQSLIPGFDEDEVPEIYDSLYDLEADVLDSVMASNLRGILTTAMEHLITPGDCVVFQDDDFNFQVFRLDQFTIKRDGAGRWKELIVREWIDTDLEDPLFEQMNGGTKLNSRGAGAHNKLEPRYTKISWDNEDNKWIKTVEFRDEKVEEWSGEYKKDLCPYYPLRWSSIANEDYARSLVEENQGDIRSVEGLAKAFLEGAAASSEGRVLVDPTGFTQLEDLEDSVNWQYVAGRKEDVDFLQADTSMQLQQVFMARQHLEQGLASVFLTDQIAQLNGDRVTATQVRAVAANLEEALGGVFSLISRDFQLPMIRRSMHLMLKRFKERYDPRIKQLFDKDLLNIQVRTGLDALGRELDAARITGILEVILRYPAKAQSVIKWDEASRDLIRTQGLNANWVMTQEEQAAASQQELAQSLTPDLIKQLGQGNLNGPVADPGQSNPNSA